jgi:hypothetical protein
MQLWQMDVGGARSRHGTSSGATVLHLDAIQNWGARVRPSGSVGSSDREGTREIR